MNLLEHLRKANKKNKPMRYIVAAFKKQFNLKPKDNIDVERLQDFAREYYGQLLALRVPDLERPAEDMKLEAVNSTQVATIVSMIKARAHLIEKYISGHLKKDDIVDEADSEARPVPGGAQLEYDGEQELFEANAKKSLDKTMKIIIAEDEK